MSVAVSPLNRPPPRSSAELPLRAQSVRLAVPSLCRRRRRVGGVAADGAVGQGQVGVPELNTPPPLPPAELPLTVQPVRVRLAVPELNTPPPKPLMPL